MTETAGSLAFGISLPGSFAAGPVDADTLTGIAVMAEGKGFSSVACGDHLIWHSVLLDPLLVLAHVGASTERIALMTSLLLAPLRHPLWVAKQVGTLQHLVGERLVLGMGIGGELPQEYDALGLDVTQRGRRLDAALDVLERGWAEQDDVVTYEHDGTKYALAPAHRRPPIWLGGRGEAALNRVAARADGLLSIFSSPAKLREMRAELDVRAEKQERDPATIRLGLQVFVCHDSSLSRATARAADYMEGHFGSADQRLMRHVITGDEAAIRAGLESYTDCGIDFLQTHIVGDRPRETAEAVASALAPHLPGSLLVEGRTP